MSNTTVVDNLLLSHHGPADRYRCLVLPLPRGRYLVCSRCLGALLGLVIGLPVFWVYPYLFSPWLVFLAFPDWIAHSLLRRRGSNAIRLVSGAIIGLVYALNLREILHGRLRLDLWVVNVSAVAVYVLIRWLNSRVRTRRALNQISR